MIVSHEYKFIFVHIPRTGGTTITSCFPGGYYVPDIPVCHSPTHIKVSDFLEYESRNDFYKPYSLKNRVSTNEEVKRRLSNPSTREDTLLMEKWRKRLRRKFLFVTKKNLENYCKWTMVRNPWDRIVSIYHKRKSRPIKDSDSINLAKRSTFKKWIRLKEDGIFKTTKRVKPKFRGFPSQKKFIINQGLNFVARFEEFDKDLNYIHKKLKIKSPLLIPHVNKSKHLHYSEYYDKEDIEVMLGYNEFVEDLDYLGYDHAP